MSKFPVTPRCSDVRTTFACAMVLLVAAGALGAQSTRAQGRVGANSDERSASVTREATVPEHIGTSAEATMTEGFTEGSVYAGPRITLSGGYGGAIGLHVERAIAAPRMNVAKGRLGVGASIDVYSYSDAAFGTRWSYRVIPITATANYHFTLQNSRIDPFVGVVIGYSIVSTSVDGPMPGDNSAGASAFGVGLQWGARYFVKPNLAVQAQTGLGYGALGLGVAWKR